MMNHPDFKTINEPLLQTIVKVLGQEDRYKSELEPVFEKVCKTIEANTAEGKHTFIKEHALAFEMGGVPEYLERLVKDYNAQVLYLMRHPKFTTTSYQGIVKNVDDPLYQLDQVNLAYDVAWDFYKTYGGEVFLTEDLVRNAEETM